MEEIWKDIEGFPGYQVSNLGRVRSHNKITSSARFSERHWKDRVLKQKVSKKDSCCRVTLWKDGVECTALVHRLVANEFCGKNIDSNLTVNHKDGNRLNNNAENLEWMSLADNIKYGFTHGQYQQKSQVIEDGEGNYMIFRSKAALGRFTGRSNSYLDDRKERNEPICSTDGKKYYFV